MTAEQETDSLQRKLNPDSLEPEMAASYRDLVRDKLSVPGIGEYFHYDERGHLWIGDLRIVDAVAMYGTPLEIIDTTVVETRCQQWEKLCDETAREVGYNGGFVFCYATKANPSFEVVQTVVKAGWNIETSSAQDLDNLYWMIRNGLLKKGEIKIICNGFKLPPQFFGSPTKPEVVKSRVVFETKPQKLIHTEEDSYGDYISLLRQLGVNVIPILDSGDLNYFAQREEIPTMEVGLRMKFGRVTTDEELASLISRHGMSWERILKNADRIESIPHLTLTTLHAMVGAAETIPVEKFVGSLIFAAEKYFKLKKNHPGLQFLDIGGGIPPMSQNYDYIRLLREFLGGVKELASSVNLPEPTIIFELGSFIAAEAGMTVFKVIQEKRNEDGTHWVIIDGGLMATVPDALMTEKKFDILAANNANHLTEESIIGDITCDTDGRYPTEKMGGQKVFLPKTDLNTDWPMTIVFNETGAYQNMLSGEGGAHHCLLREAAKLVLERGNDGQIHVYCVPRQTSREVRELLGYTTRT